MEYATRELQDYCVYEIWKPPSLVSCNARTIGFSCNNLRLHYIRDSQLVTINSVWMPLLLPWSTYVTCPPSYVLRKMDMHLFRDFRQVEHCKLMCAVAFEKGRAQHIVDHSTERSRGLIRPAIPKVYPQHLR